MHILIVADNQETKAGIMTVLDKKGHTLYSAAAAEEAFQILSGQEEIHLVLAHWMMQGIDPKPFYSHIKKKIGGRFIYIIAIMASDNKPDSIEALNAGADDYILVPFSNDELNAKIQVTGRIVNLEKMYKRSLQESRALNDILKKSHDELKNTQKQMLQTEKMASIGQLAAGVAHEINNPAGFVASNLSSLTKHLNRILELQKKYDEGFSSLQAG
ncbi:MAG: response regulator, partial [Pseudomonadota bacterium]